MLPSDGPTPPMLSYLVIDRSEITQLYGNSQLQITYGDPNVRMPHLNRPAYNWQIVLYIICKALFIHNRGVSCFELIKEISSVT